MGKSKSSSSQGKTKTRRFGTAGIISLVLALVLMAGAGSYVFLDSSRDKNPNVNNLSAEEIAQAEETQQASFSLIDADSIMVSHVNTEALTGDALNQWWDWYQKMLPPYFTNIDDLSEIEGLNSVTIAVSATKNREYADGYPLYHHVLFATDSANGSQLMNSLQTLNSGEEPPPSFLTMNEEIDGKMIISLTSIHGLEDASEIASDPNLGFQPNSDWFPVDAEPTMYVNASGYLSTMLGQAVKNTEFADATREVMTATFGFTDESGFTWLGRSSDFGNTWHSDEVSDIENIDPKSVSYDTLSQMQSRSIEDAMNDSVLIEEDIDGVEFAFGVMDDMGMLPILEAVSVSTPGEVAIGAVLDPYSPDATYHAAPPVSEGTSFAVMVSPVMWQSAFQGMIQPSHVKNVLAEVQEDGSSSLTFNFYQEGEPGYVG